MSADVLNVIFEFSPVDEVLVGRVALDGNAAVFEYDNTFASSGLSLNPSFDAAMPGLVRPRDPRAFDGLHGVFADSLPDAWGQLLFERQLRDAGVAAGTLTILDRLAYVGRRGRGALVYEPSLGNVAADRRVDLDHLALEANVVLEGGESDVLRELERLGGSSGGARPKVHVALDESGNARSGDDVLPAGFTHWIVKFHARADRFADIGPLEAAYSQVARGARIDIPRTRLIPAKSAPGYFATERFDRGPNGQRSHMLSAAGMLDAQWALPSVSYENLMDAIRGATRDQQAVLEMFRRMVFNVLAVNRDDHAKQHSLLMDRAGHWRLSPAYDLTLAFGPGNEHYLAVNGRGRNITRPDLLAVADRQSIAKRIASEIIDEVATAVETLPAIARDFGVTSSTLRELGRATAEQLSLMTTTHAPKPTRWSP